jgi:hypothetical protein
MKRHLAEKKFSFESPTMTYYPWSFDIFCITLTVFELFELFTENRFDGYRDKAEAVDVEAEAEAEVEAMDVKACFDTIFSFESQTSTSYS